MGNTLFQAVCRTGILVICAQAIVHFRPKEVYEKYLKLLVGVMVLIQLFLPIGNFFAGGNLQNAAGQLEQFRESLDEAMSRAQEEAARSAQWMEQATLEEVRRQLEEQQAQGAQSGEGEGTEGSSGERTEGSETDVSSEGQPDIHVEVAPVEPVQIPR